VPAFKRGDFAGGLEAGLAQIDERLRAHPEEAREGTRRGAQPAQVAQAEPAEPITYAMTPPEEPRAPGRGGLFFGLGALGVVGTWLGVRTVLRRRERTCAPCKREMRLVDEVEDDGHLDAGQRAEERVKSVDYLVYICGQCQGSRTVARRRWFSGFSRCGRCNYRTLHSRSVTLVSATYDHGGQVRVDEDCQHCDFHRTYTRYTSRLTRSSSSSSGGSSGGSSFGGGRSGGGGAGSSW
jgi:uncharacterized protein